MRLPHARQLTALPTQIRFRSRGVCACAVDEMTTTVARSGPAAPATLPGPPGYIMRVAARHTEDDSGEPLVLELHGAAQELIASAVGLLPVREDLTAVMTTSVLSRPLLELLQHASPQE